jgi:hypothetical protein
MEAMQTYRTYRDIHVFRPNQARLLSRIFDTTFTSLLIYWFTHSIIARIKVARRLDMNRAKRRWPLTVTSNPGGVCKIFSSKEYKDSTLLANNTQLVKALETRLKAFRLQFRHVQLLPFVLVLFEVYES